MHFSLYQSRQWGIRSAVIKRIVRSIDTVIPKYRQSEISLAIVSNAAIKKLNTTYRHKPAVTDVLSFAEADSIHPKSVTGGRYLGEIVIAYPRTRAQARSNKQSVQSEFMQLLVHGFLHLIGHDHYKKAAARVMQRCERQIRRVFEKEE